MAVTPVALALLAVAAVGGAFAGPADSRTMFNSIPAVTFWVLLAATFVAGFVAFSALRRNVGLAAIHAGCLLILVGGFLGGKYGATLRKALGLSDPHRKLILINRNAPTNRLYEMDETSPEVLPAGLQLRSLRFETQPLARWPLIVYFSRASCMGRPMPVDSLVPWSLNEWIDVPETDVRLRVLSHQPARYRASNEVLAGPVLEVELERAGKVVHGLLSADPTLASSDMPLELLFASPDEWTFADEPRLALQQPIKSFLIDVTVHEAGREGRPETLAISRPLRCGSNYVYAHQFNDIDADRIALAVVADPGWPVAQAGLFLLGGGMIVALWITPAIRRMRRQTTAPEVRPKL